MGQNTNVRDYQNRNENNVKPAQQAIEIAPCNCGEEKGALRKVTDTVAGAVKSVGNSFKEAPVKTTAKVVVITALTVGAVKVGTYGFRQIKAHGLKLKEWDKPKLFNFKKKKGSDASVEEAPAE